MDCKHFSVCVLLFALLPISVVFIDSSDADWTPEETWYCYGIIMTLKYPYDSTGLTIDWTVECYSDGVLDEVQTSEGPNVLIDVRDYDIVHVTQVVTSIETGDTDSKSIDVIPIESKPGEFIVIRFMDGTHELAREELNKDNAVRLGDPFVVVPEDPSKTNYRFTRWFLDKECTWAFNPLIPILQDTAVYAGWASTGTSGAPPSPDTWSHSTPPPDYHTR